ncbi:VWA domain-containing protein [Cryobacterium zhongshanensis]|uniref:VWA domain-containing protein n=1 Tax=Cryobacterium zhongshanensis TaxID=2928153 RepID=A0AA41UF13_9MICO|nr:VWA domain-containing protein [Cryobacterium zhongshanensis]MCI4657622.1 VWA domain-containing protein [Cryobacterium zhongshanensis]
MELTWPWLPPLLFGSAGAAALLVVAVSILRDRARRREPHRGIPVANLSVIRVQPRFRRALIAYRTLLVGAIVIAMVALSAGVITASRVMDTTTETPEIKNRDIVLCLDVSGSMQSFDAALLANFADLAHDFSGERIGLVLFDGSPLQVFPLTTDYEFVRAQIAEVMVGLSHSATGYSYRSGTSVDGGSSRVGDGVAGCVLQFDRPGVERSRTIVLATDNRSGSGSIVTLDEADTAASARGIKVYGLNPDHRVGGVPSVTFQGAVESTGGRYFPTTTDADSTEAIHRIVNTVTADPATAITGTPIRTSLDKPDQAIWVLTAATALLLLLIWRVKL